MKEIIDALKKFESRNNLSAFITVHSDGTCELLEFWEEDVLGTFHNCDDLLSFLLNTQYALDEKGVCIRPCNPINPQ